MTDRVLILTGLIIAILTCCALLWKHVVRPVITLTRGTSQFLGDWNGEPSRPGFDAQRGVMERLRDLETGARTNAGHIADIKDQVKNSHTTNLRNDIDGIRAGVKAVGQQLADHVAAVTVTDADRATTDRTIGSLAEAMPIIASSTPPDDH